MTRDKAFEVLKRILKDYPCTLVTVTCKAGSYTVRKLPSDRFEIEIARQMQDLRDNPTLVC